MTVDGTRFCSGWSPRRMAEPALPAVEVVLDAVGEPTRRAILARLRHGPCSVTELARDLPVTRPAVSQHLKVLKEAGLVTDTQAGNRRLYKVDPRGLEEVRRYFDRYWNNALDAFKQAAERTDEEER
jgi:DNA-binding transcriptional ArsR family regulator